MKSRLQRELESTIGSTSDRLVWARSMCRLALHFARQGEREEALKAIGTVRASLGTELDADTAAFLILAEGVLNFCKGDLVAAVDRLRRAYAIANALQGRLAKPICAAWLALMALNTRRFEDVAPFTREALTLAAPDDYQARARASLVLADAFAYSGRFDLARPWYEKARLHATSEGDEATVSAMLHNVAAFRAANVRLADALGTGLPEDARRAAMEAASAEAYDRAIGTKSFGAFLPHVNEQLLIVEKRYAEALIQLNKIGVVDLPTRVHAVHYADHATCAFAMGDGSLAAELCQSALGALQEFTMDPDDIAYVSSRLAMIYKESGNDRLADELLSRASDAIAEHRYIQANLFDHLMKLTASLPVT